MNGSFDERGWRMAYFSPAQALPDLSYLRFCNGVWITMAFNWRCKFGHWLWYVSASLFLPWSFTHFLTTPPRSLTRHETGHTPLSPCLLPQTTPTRANRLHSLRSHKYRLSLKRPILDFSDRQHRWGNRLFHASDLPPILCRVVTLSLYRFYNVHLDLKCFVDLRTHPNRPLSRPLTHIHRSPNIFSGSCSISLSVVGLQRDRTYPILIRTGLWYFRRRLRIHLVRLRIGS